VILTLAALGIYGNRRIDASTRGAQRDPYNDLAVPARATCFCGWIVRARACRVAGEFQTAIQWRVLSGSKELKAAIACSFSSSSTNSPRTDVGGSIFIHAENDYSTASGPALAAEMQRLAKAHALKIYPPFGEDMRAGTISFSALSAPGSRTSSPF
jgi:hypothetical protein